MTKAEINTLRRLIECAEVLDKRPRPRCRDCADDGPTCPHSGLECDMRNLFADAKALHNKLAAPVEQEAAPDERSELRVDTEFLIAMLDNVVGAAVAAFDSAYCPSSQPFKDARKRMRDLADALRAAINAITHQPTTNLHHERREP